MANWHLHQSESDHHLNKTETTVWLMIAILLVLLGAVVAIFLHKLGA